MVSTTRAAFVVGRPGGWPRARRALTVLRGGGELASGVTRVCHHRAACRGRDRRPPVGRTRFDGAARDIFDLQTRYGSGGGGVGPASDRKSKRASWRKRPSKLDASIRPSFEPSPHRVAIGRGGPDRHRLPDQALRIDPKLCCRPGLCLVLPTVFATRAPGSRGTTKLRRMKQCEKAAMAAGTDDATLSQSRVGHFDAKLGPGAGLSTMENALLSLKHCPALRRVGT